MSSCDHQTRRTRQSSENLKENSQMKKFMTLMLGLSLALGAVSVSFADDAPKKEGKKKGGKKKKDETKKENR